jgi:beta-ureidopropionase
MTMKAVSLFRLVMIGCMLWFGTSAQGASPAVPGRPVRVAAIAIGFGGQYEAKLKLAREHLEAAGQRGVDIACLPEEFAGNKAEPIPGPTTRAIGELAKKHKMWVVCPICEQAGNEKYNTAVLLNREGEVTGQYRKMFVFWGEGVQASRAGVKVFDTDFGRVALLICFDANYDELWQEAGRQGAEMVLWPSAYGGGLPLNGYAMIHNYCIVPVGVGNILDCFGRKVEAVESPLPKQYIATLDLDVTPVHKDFNGDKIKNLLREHAGEVELMPGIGDLEGWYVLRAIKPGVRARDLCREHQIETLWQYRQRSRELINQARKEGKRIDAYPAR